MSVQLFGIANCDTVRKARAWLDACGIAYVFHDYKKAGADSAQLAAWADAAGLDILINRRGTTFRKLDQGQKAALDKAASGTAADRDGALRVLAANPSMIRRPIVEHPGGLLVGFDEAEWREALGRP